MLPRFVQALQSSRSAPLSSARFVSRTAASRPLNQSFLSTAWMSSGFRRFYSSGPVIGIDLGTTNSCVAVIDSEGKALVLENDGKRTTPSVFAIDKQGARLVGHPAQRQMVINPRNTFFATKRLIGRRFDEKETQELKKQVSFSIVPGPNGDAWVAEESGRKLSPSEVASNILIKMREVAEKHFGEKVTRAVITVPAYFDNHQRQATEDAGKIAGLKVERIINEPTAAALAYGISREEDKTVVVYDLGGGTFDVSILQMGAGVFEVKSTAGDTFLGGEDFNTVIIEHLVDVFKKKEGIDLSSDKIALQRIREAAETAKHELSNRETTSVSLPYITQQGGQPKSLDTEITRAKYEGMVKHLVQKTMQPCQKALNDAGMTISDVTDVILVGGMTRMPMVRDFVKKFFRKEPFIGVNPDEAVAVGAALQGSIISNKGLVPGSSEQRELVLLDVTPLNLGIELADETMAVIIEAQTSIPCTKSHVFTTVQPFQTELNTKVYQGNRPIAKHNRLLGEYRISGIPPAPAGVPKIEVTFGVSANGTITSTSTDRATGISKALTINMSGGLSDADIERMRKEADQNREKDLASQNLLQAQEEARRSISKFEESMKSPDSGLSESDKQTVKNEIKKVQTIIEKGGQKGDLEKAVKAMEGVVGKIFEQSYLARAQRNSQKQ